MHCTYFLILTSSIIFTTMAASKLTKEMSSIATSNTQFGFDLFRFCGREQPNQNLFMSPFSISTALALTHLGARGDTAKEMKKVLHWSSDEEIARGFGGYLPLLKQSDGAGYVLVGAQRVYVSKILSVNPDFNKAATQQFSADAQKADFRGNPDVERVNINKWVGDQTRGKVQDLLPSGSITPDTAMVLIQATYFKGKWMHQFNPRLTQKAEFYAPGGTLMVDMMRKEREFHYHHNEELKCAAVELPYMNNTGGDYGHDLSMLVLLPDARDGLNDLEAQLSHDSLDKIMKSLRSVKVNLQLPRFSMESSFKLKKSLSSLGMPTAFSDADFTGIANGLSISEVFHKDVIDVNEEGSEAAAATAVHVNEEGSEAAAATGMVMKRMPIIKPFVADHPFLFFIADKRAVVDLNEEGSEAAAATGVVRARRSVPIIVLCIADHPFLFFITDKRADMVLFMGRLFKPSSGATSRDEL
ncbi:hypothetical protein BaRGS_00031617 [Batillaria attramentaria]|uniref:Serpin domain-containing protein n=1 Tax=Batillaria attramentaria TaxID=370345 RepID=A0ABD0JQG8_9CAEN